MLGSILTLRAQPVIRLLEAGTLVAALFIVIGTTVAFADSGVSASTSPATPTASATSCRYGVSALGANQLAALGPLGASWYINFWSVGYTAPPGIEFVPVIRIRQMRDGCTRLPGYIVSPPLSSLDTALRSQPGSLWIIGNEPDRGPNPEDATCTGRTQDDTAPEVYAQAYFDLYHYIKGIDPTAKVANAGLVEVTPGRLQYLDIVWNTYKALFGTEMPVDVWNMHLYILPEALPNGGPNGIASIAVGTDPKLAIRESGNDPANCARSDVYCWAEHDDMTEFARQVTAMRQWMKDHGQRQKPLILSEYSLLYPYILTDPADPTSCFLRDEYGNCFTPERVVAFLHKSMNYLETTVSSELGYSHDGNRLVQRWLWFTTYTTGVGDVSSLVTQDLTQLTAVGNAYFAHAATSFRGINLFPAAAHGRSTFGADGRGNGAALMVEVRNQGAAPTGQSFTVSFYRDSNLSDLIGSVTVPRGLAGCESRTAYVQQSWTDLAPGWHSYWVKVDSGWAIDETDETDNVIEGRVFVANRGLWLPLISRRANSG